MSFDPEEAESLLDIFVRITQRSKENVAAHKAKLSYAYGDKERILELQELINIEIQKWSEKMTKLGAVPMSLWKVKIPGENENYFTWEFPQEKLNIWSV